MEATTPTSTHDPATAAALRDFEALARRDADGMKAAYADDAVVEFIPLGLVVRGSDGVKEFFTGLFTAVPDLETTYEVVATTDDTVVVEWRMRGHFTGGAFQGIEPNGREVELRGIDKMRIENDRIAQNTAYYDGMNFARQVGMLPAQDSAGEKAMLGAFNAMTKLRSRLSQQR
jgi:steroid delta-isomerase-like uncharacterized protein